MSIHTIEIKTQPALCPLPCDDYTTILEVPGSFSLADLAIAILDAIGFDADHAFEFFDNPRNQYASKVRYSVFADHGEDDPEEGQTVHGVFAEQGTALGFLFDYGDNWIFRVTSLGIADDTKTKSKKARQVSAVGTPPVQYPDFG
jgi:hypothetical protein